MNKEEFLRTLGAALSGEVPQHIIQENLRYYDNYISGEVARGRTEEEIMEELGGPRLIAKTIIDAAEAGGESVGGQAGGSYGGYDTAGTYGSSGAYGGESQRERGGESGQPYGSYRNDTEKKGSFHVYNMSTWYWKLVGIVILALVVCFLFVIIGGIASLLLSPFGLILIIALILWRNQK